MLYLYNLTRIIWFRKTLLYCSQRSIHLIAFLLKDSVRYRLSLNESGCLTITFSVHNSKWTRLSFSSNEGI